MQLLNVHTYRLERFPDERSTPPYAILSHMWADGKEVQHADMLKHSFDNRDDGLDWKKIDFTCKQAIADGFTYAWIDTCCIDKSSSAELSEAINSMFRWYRAAKVCYVYMSDVGIAGFVNDNGEGIETSPNLTIDPETNDPHLSVPMTSPGLSETLQVQQSRWFTRGWTLQELIAPPAVVFYDCNWRLLGDRARLLPYIAAATRIPSDFLEGRVPLHDVGIAVRMSWASRRETTHIEDEAYCLLGIFDINMPLLYGEGQKAFTRLQEEIMKVSSDHTIFAWNGPERQLLAPAPVNFADSATIVPRDFPNRDDVYEMTNRGCRISLALLYDPVSAFAVLDCVDLRAPNTDVCLPLSADRGEHRPIVHAEPGAHFLRLRSPHERYNDYHFARNARVRRRDLVIQRFAKDEPKDMSLTIKIVLTGCPPEYVFCQLYPEGSWDEETRTSIVHASDRDECDVSHRNRAVWVGYVPAPNTRSTAYRFLQWLVRRRGLLIAWISPDPRISDKITFDHRRCGHRTASRTATRMLRRLDRYRNQDVFPSGSLSGDHVLSYNWAKFTVGFSIEPIGIHQSGMTVVVNFDDGEHGYGVFGQILNKLFLVVSVPLYLLHDLLATFVTRRF
ncbi:hypothetical protein M409DRAFT_27966 [Zasmidium cellare ATCC 36951]|uniref:Uncharacterized protein n=1 Tax=Zasmidium cellare ATCC 36951 TaxID=1080233 RepID=A0A6A6C5N5_ZASCE|nr:uncharacterized protein M409DRAFT_27966 [Zasmidium cellare ATCC 36951]KAF2161568.1 hypothetical protein M409DRAFT_27966 [Zasmidium cellare ATCC 36951]